ncbi:MAG: DUF86 domain-containing protein [Methanosarcinaceae archaeon]|nr:DUF86 domain-containing protein [Methanosarcinaceae archaeon]MDO9518374.1 DUF86 domain-containing protein [Methanosarcinaceae archaeon]
MDIERILDKIDEMDAYISELSEYVPDDEESYHDNKMQKRACERAFQLSCETLLDICNLIIAGKSFGLPKNSKDSMEKLAEHGIISKNLAIRLSEMVGFRNLLVHKYGTIDDSMAFNYLSCELKDFYEFLEAVEAFTKK